MRKYRNAASDYEYGAMLGENLNFAASGSIQASAYEP